MKKYTHLFFDLDGTLTDSKEGIISTFRYTCEKMGADYKNLELAQFLGPPLTESFQKIVGSEKTGEAIDCYRERYARIGLFENRLYDDVPEMLQQLKENGCRLSVATSKLEDFAKQILEHYGVYHYFDYVTGSLPDNTRQDKAHVLAKGLERARCAPSEALMIGDRSHDMIGAEKNLMDALGVLYGYGAYEELAAHRPVKLVNSPMEIPSYVL